MAIKHLRHRAFTLVELIVVISILAILATVWFLSLSGYSDDARTATLKANVRTVYSAILTESTTTGNSPRYYVDHGTGAALSGAFVFVDGKQVALTGGDLGVGDSNYTAGNPRWDRLRMNGDKFRLAFAGPVGCGSADGSGVPVSEGRLPCAFEGFGTLGNEASAGYSTGELAVGAVDVFKTGANGKKRATPYFQVAGVVPGSKATVVSGNLAGGTAGGLIKDPASADPTYSLADGLPSGKAAPENCKAIKAGYPSAADGTYRVDPDGTGPNAPITAYCDMTIDGGGWTLVSNTRSPEMTAVNGGVTTSSWSDGTYQTVTWPASEILYECYQTPETPKRIKLTNMATCIPKAFGNPYVLDSVSCDITTNGANNFVRILNWNGSPNWFARFGSEWPAPHFGNAMGGFWGPNDYCDGSVTTNGHRYFVR